MEPTWDADGLVRASSENVDRYKRNYLRQAVCELRFPTLMELGGVRPPEQFVSALRKDYPYLELQNELRLNIGGASETNNTHVFRSANMQWTVSLRQSSISIETSNYTQYDQLRTRVLKIIDAGAKIIDADFFTRIGLRYINVVDGMDEPSNGWINPALVAPLAGGVFKGVNEYAGKLQLAAKDGGCLLQHGIRLVSTKKDAPVQIEYMIDVDAYRSEVELPQAARALDAMHEQAFNVFDWSLGEKAREYLSVKQ